MLKDVWDSFKDNIKERTTNPFLGTFVIVWVIHNWQIVYSFFYFDKDWKIEKKIQYFNKYWSDHNFFLNLALVAFYTFLVLIITYLFLAIARYLSNYFENVVIPFVYKFSKGKTVTIETYQSVLNKIDALETRVEAERKAKNDALQERDDLEKRIYAKNSPDSKELTITDAVTINTDYSDMINKLNLISEKSKIDQAFLGISKEFSFADSPIIDFLLRQDFIVFESMTVNGNRKYKFTDSGIEFRRQYYAKTK